MSWAARRWHSLGRHGMNGGAALVVVALLEVSCRSHAGWVAESSGVSRLGSGSRSSSDEYELEEAYQHRTVYHTQ